MLQTMGSRSQTQLSHRTTSPVDFLTVFPKYDFWFAVHHSPMWPSAQFLNSSAGGGGTQSRSHPRRKDRSAQQ